MAVPLVVALVLAQQLILREVNHERQSLGVTSLVQDDCLTILANQRANDMLRRDYFSHITPDGLLPWDAMRADGCSFRYAAENIAEAPDPLFAVIELWNSPEHRRNTLDAHYHKVGIGAAVRADGTEIVVEDFTD
jgi:uncharacterized protein YkwD